eukprot:5928854-Pleurochrysis_carterae.AAC.2
MSASCALQPDAMTYPACKGTQEGNLATSSVCQSWPIYARLFPMGHLSMNVEQRDLANISWRNVMTFTQASFLAALGYM